MNPAASRRPHIRIWSRCCASPHVFLGSLGCERNLHRPCSRARQNSHQGLLLYLLPVEPSLDNRPPLDHPFRVSLSAPGASGSQQRLFHRPDRCWQASFFRGSSCASLVLRPVESSCRRRHSCTVLPQCGSVYASQCSEMSSRTPCRSCSRERFPCARRGGS